MRARSPYSSCAAQGRALELTARPCAVSSRAELWTFFGSAEMRRTLVRFQEAHKRALPPRNALACLRVRWRPSRFTSHANPRYRVGQPSMRYAVCLGGLRTQARSSHCPATPIHDSLHHTNAPLMAPYDRAIWLGGSRTLVALRPTPALAPNLPVCLDCLRTQARARRASTRY